jgi:hypothetical protein
MFYPVKRAGPNIHQRFMDRAAARQENGLMDVAVVVHSVDRPRPVALNDSVHRLDRPPR